MNQFRNELKVTIGGSEILLRPTFENIAQVESNVGSISYLAWKFSRGVRRDATGGIDKASLSSEETIKGLPSLTEMAQIVYYCQAEKTHDLNSIWELIIGSGSSQSLLMQVTVFIGKMLAGSSFEVKEETLNESEKKS